MMSLTPAALALSIIGNLLWSYHCVLKIRRQRTEIQRFAAAARAVLSDHDERMRIYPHFNDQPHRMKVMGMLRAALGSR